jgi:hypothetical protein
MEGAASVIAAQAMVNSKATTSGDSPENSRQASVRSLLHERGTDACATWCGSAALTRLPNGAGARH